MNTGTVSKALNEMTLEELRDAYAALLAQHREVVSQKDAMYDRLAVIRARFDALLK